MSVTLDISNDGIAVLRVSRPQVRNALDWKSITALREHIEHAHTLPALRTLVLTGTEDVFIAGGDLKVLHNYSTRADGERLSREMTITLQRLEALPCPTIAAINGPARGGGAEVCLACDLRIMARNADLGFVQIKLALVTGWGGGQRLLRMVGYSHAMELLVSGRILSAEEAWNFGLVNRLAGKGEALQVAVELAQEISGQSVGAVRTIKRMLRGGLTLQPTTAAAHENSEFPDIWAAEEHLHAVEKYMKRGK